MKRTRRIQAAFLTAMLAASSMTVLAEETSKLADGDVTLTIFCDFQSGARAYYTDLGDNPVVQKIEEETGINLEFIHAPAGDDGSYFQQLLASGELPDLMFTNLFQTNYPGGVEGAIEDGILYDVTELVEEHATNFWALCEQSEDPEIEKKIRGDQGKIIKFGSIFLPETNNNKIFNGLIVRQDWLDKYGLEAPVTIDDYTNVLRVFKENGVEYPLALCQFEQSQFYANNPIASAFDVTINDFNVDEEGNIHYSRTEDGYKEFLEVLKGWADEGLIDTGMVSRTIDDSLKLFESGQAGMCFAHTYNVKMATVAGPAVDPEFKLTSLVHPRVNEDDELHLSKITSSINSQSWQVSAMCEDPELAVKFVDYLMDPDTLLMSAWGTNEGVETYVVNEEGVREFSDFVVNNPDGLDYDTVRDLYMCEPFQIKYDNTMEASQYSLEECHQSWDAWMTANDMDHVLPVNLTLTVDESKEVTQIKTKLANYSDEMVYNFIFGGEDLETGWDGFVEQLKDLGSERAEEIYKAAYDRYQARGEE
ncbi:MAG: extracellular solute-binding protein [Lachnospiraceae bacterium]|nr:extracellular solute-binding protein [Lachnospiraceae bacterium]